MINKALSLIKKNRFIVSIVSVVLVIVIIVLSMRMKESFTVIDLVIPPLEVVSTVDYAYGCAINGYRCQPKMIYKIELQGKGIFKDTKYIKYKMVDKENIVRHSGLYKNVDGLQVGEYVIFENGQEYVITSLDTVEPPVDCPTTRRESLKE